MGKVAIWGVLRVVAPIAAGVVGGTLATVSPDLFAALCQPGA